VVGGEKGGKGEMRVCEEGERESLPFVLCARVVVTGEQICSFMLVSDDHERSRLNG